MKYCPNVRQIIDVMYAKNYRVFKNVRGYDLNIIGIRSNDTTSNSFNDWLSIFYNYDNRFVQFNFPCTTDPGTFYRNNPLNDKGTAVIVPNQFRSLWKTGKHRNYEALVQKNEIKVYRDNNKDDKLDFENIESGFFGINLHRAHKEFILNDVNKFSAGCQVVQDPLHFDFIMLLCSKAKELYGDGFTYTLLEENDFN